jgi:short-subunit dehydrogenase
VVIYGTHNPAGQTYAFYLADKGFNLILIERDMQPLNDLENKLKEKFSQRAA